MFCFYRLTHTELSHEDCASLASSLQSPDCPLRELHLGVIRVYDDDDLDLSVVYAALRGPHCKLETLRSVPVEESSHDDNTNMNTLLNSWLV